MSTSLKSLYGSSNNVALDMQFITASQTYTAVRTGRYRITAIGAGGSGGAATAGHTATLYAWAQGGCAGGVSQKTVSLTASNTLTIVIGAGGSNVSVKSDFPPYSLNGNPGGNTTVVGPGISLTANGGPGGLATLGTTIISAQTGGTATGGDLNNTGGGQPARPTSTSSGSYGGASIGLTSTGYAPTNAVGAGVGGSAGYSLIGPVQNGMGNGYNIAGNAIPASFYSVANAPSFFSLMSGTFSVNGSGFGTGGYYSSTMLVIPGIGGGGSTQIGGQSNIIYSGFSATYGGGGGGCTSMYANGYINGAGSGAGGAGLVVIEFLG